MVQNTDIKRKSRSILLIIYLNILKPIPNHEIVSSMRQTEQIKKNLKFLLINRRAKKKHFQNVVVTVR